MAKRPFQHSKELVKYTLIFALAVLVVIGVVILFGQAAPAPYMPNFKNAL